VPAVRHQSHAACASIVSVMLCCHHSGAKAQTLY
jgi:hypothetical protein